MSEPIGEKEISLEDVLEWADGVHAALSTEFMNRVTIKEQAIAWAILARLKEYNDGPLNHRA